MNTPFELFSDQFWTVLGLIGLALVLTITVFRRHLFDEGYEKGDAADPDRVRRENPPDDEMEVTDAAQRETRLAFK